MTDIEIYNSLSPMQKYYILNKDKLKEKRHEYYWKHRDEIIRRNNERIMRKRILTENLSGK